MNLNPDDYYFGTIGSFDAVVSKKNGYSLLKSGLYISDSDYVKHSSTNLQLATIGTVTLVDAGSYTNVVIPMNTKANHVVWQYDDRAEIIIYNVENKDSITSSMNGVKTLFSDITIKEAGENAIKIILTYQKELHIFGYYCSFESDNLIVHFKNPVKISEGSKMLTGIKISLDPGHSDNNGALGFWGTQKFYESQLNLILSRKVAEKLTALGAEVQLTHNGEGTKGLDALISKLRVWAPDINISIHFNSISDDLDPNKISGCETYYSFSQSKLLAQSLLDLFNENTPIRKRSVKQGYYKVTRFTEFPSVLFETAFITNPTEYEWFMSDNNIDQAANAIVAGVVTYFQSIS